MTRILVFSILLASALAIAPAASAQPLPPNPAVTLPSLPPIDTSKPLDPANWFAGSADLQVLGRDDVASSKFEEYRIVPKGPSLPVFQFQGAHAGRGFAVLGRNIGQQDQRYTGWGSLDWATVRFDYNQIPHNMGNDGRSIHSEVAPENWAMSAMLRKALGDAVDATPTANRTYPFYVDLLAPTIAAANHYDVSSERQRGQYDVDLSKVGLDFSYVHDQKTGFRGASGGDILGVVTMSPDVLEPLNEVTQDFGLRWKYEKPKKGRVYASFNRNLYDDLYTSLTIDNPFRATDLAFVSTSVPGGPGQVRFSTPPDNEANRFAFGGQLMFARQTRVTADLAFGRWTQNAPFLPYTINSTVVTGSGAPANLTSSLQQASLDGKADIASYNFTFTSRPTDPVALRLRYRNYSYKDKSARYVIAGDTSSAPDRSWGAADAPSADYPFGQQTANRPDSSVGHFEAQVGYDIAPKMTVEGVYRNLQTSYAGRVATSATDNSENGYTLALVCRTKDWLDFRFHFDDNTRKVSGIEAASLAAVQGVMADHAERDQTRIGLNATISPKDAYAVTFGYNRRHDDYPNRPFKVAGDSTTESGLLEASYDMFSVDFSYAPGPRAELSAFYSYEKSAETNQWVTLTSGALNNRLTYAPYNKGNTFGVNGVFHLVPDKWTLNVFVQQQDVNGFNDITAREAGSFYTPGRTTLIPPGQGGAADMSDFDDMRQTTAVFDLGYSLAKAWTFTVGYAYDKYTFADAFSDGTAMMPQAVLLFLKANSGNYSANIGYTRLSYRF